MSTKNGAIRWTIQRASVEFGLHRETLAKYLRREGVHPGSDGKFSTHDICRGVFGDLSGQRTREVKAKADLLEIELAKARNEVIHRENVFALLENVFVAIKSKIMSSHLSELEQDQILNDLASLRDDPDL